MMDNSNDKMIRLFEQFIRNVTHEINNPLTTIKGYSQLMGVKKDNVEFVEKGSTTISSQVQRIEDIFSEIYRTFTLKKGDVIEINLNSEIKNLLSGCDCGEKVSIELDESISINTDKILFKFIFKTLLCDFDFENNNNSTIRVYSKKIDDFYRIFVEYDNVKFDDMYKKIFFLPYSSKKYFKNGVSFYKSFVICNLLEYNFDIIDNENSQGFILDIK